MNRSWICRTAACALLLPLAASADVLVTDLATASAIYDGGTIATTAGGVPQPDLAAGHTMNIEFTPGAADLTGTVLLMEIGGTANGSGLYLYNGEVFYTTKHNSGDQWIADSLNDLEVRPDGATHGEAAVLSAFGSLSAGVTYSVAASWDQLGSLSLGVQGGGAGQLDAITLTGVFGNWSGDESISVGINPRSGAGGPGGSVGGLAGEVGGNNPAAPWNVELDDETPVLQGLAGTVDRALYWNAAGTIAVIPEPSTLALAGLGLLLVGYRRFR